jgi:hypothetical protein
VAAVHSGQQRSAGEVENITVSQRMYYQLLKLQNEKNCHENACECGNSARKPEDCAVNRLTT